MRIPATVEPVVPLLTYQQADVDAQTLFIPQVSNKMYFLSDFFRIPS